MPTNETGERRQPQRHQRVVEHRIDAERQHGAERKLAFARHAALAVIFEADLVEAHGADQAAHIGRRVFDAPQFVEDAAVDEPELAGVERQIVLAQCIDQPIESRAASARHAHLSFSDRLMP